MFKKASAMFLTVGIGFIFPNCPALETATTKETSVFDPCGGSRMVPQRFIRNRFHTSFGSDQMVAQALLNKVKSVKNNTEELLARYRVERIQSSEKLTYLKENSTIASFPRHRGYSAGARFLDMLVEDYQRISEAIRFLKQIIDDENGSLFSPSYATITQQVLHSHIYHMMCVMRVYIIGKNGSLAKDRIDEARFIADMATTSMNERHERDYVILKEIVQLFHIFESEYRRIQASG